jgi:four helix bundle protein
MKENTVQQKSIDFAIRVVKLYKYLKEQKSEYILSKQLVRSGTSVGANVSEAQRAQSKADFSAKMYVALKEAEESSYWILLLKEAGFLTDKEFDSMDKDCEELIKMLAAITKTSAPRNC